MPEQNVKGEPPCVCHGRVLLDEELVHDRVASQIEFELERIDVLVKPFGKELLSPHGSRPGSPPLPAAQSPDPDLLSTSGCDQFRGTSSGTGQDRGAPAQRVVTPKGNLHESSPPSSGE